MSRSAELVTIPRVIVDGTPLLGQRTGIGRYTENLLATLALRHDVSVRATAFTLRGWRDLAAAVPAGITVKSRPFPARLLRTAWQHIDVPPIEWLAGRADIVHGTNFVLPPSRRAAGVVSIHDLVWHTHHHTLRTQTQDLKILVPRALSRAKAVLTLAEVTKQRISAEFNYPLDRIFVTPPGVGPSWFDPAPLTEQQRIEHRLPQRYFIFVGTREPRKGLDTLLAGYGLLRTELGESCPDLLVVGAQGWGIDHADSAQPGVVLAGYLPQRILPSIVAAAAALVLPSVDEGFGMPAIEALAAGTPVITTDIPVLAEATGAVGIGFPVGDVELLAGALRRVLEGEVPNLPDRLAWARGFTWEHCAEQTVLGYRRALQD